jgi:hypothetical protein
MKHSTNYNCPMLCGYTSDNSSKIEYHLINNCPKKLLIPKFFTLCKLNPSILITDENKHFSVCEECRQYKDKNITLSRDSHRFNIENNALNTNTNKNKVNYSSFSNVTVLCEESHIVNKNLKTDCISKNNYEDSMLSDSLNLNLKKESISRETKVVKREHFNDTMCRFDNPSIVQKDYSSNNTKTYKNKDYMNDTMNEGTKYSKKIIQTKNLPDINKNNEIIDDSILDSSYFLDKKSEKREKVIFEKELDLDNFQEYFAN